MKYQEKCTVCSQSASNAAQDTSVCYQTNTASAPSASSCIKSSMTITMLPKINHRVHELLYSQTNTPTLSIMQSSELNRLAISPK